jgi:hypothetical protein
MMSFSSKNLGDCYRFGIKAAVTDAGYGGLRVDEVEHNRKITGTLLQQIEATSS